MPVVQVTQNCWVQIKGFFQFMHFIACFNHTGPEEFEPNQRLSEFSFSVEDFKFCYIVSFSTQLVYIYFR